MIIRKYLGKRTQKEQSDKSSGEESDTEESLCHAEKSKTFMTCPISKKLSGVLQEKAKLHESLSLGSECEDLKVGMLCSPCRKS